jgi:hypothetical protein
VTRLISYFVIVMDPYIGILVQIEEVLFGLNVLNKSQNSALQLLLPCQRREAFYLGATTNSLFACALARLGWQTAEF